MNDDETVDDVDREATAHMQTQDVCLPRRTFSTARRNIHVISARAFYADTPTTGKCDDCSSVQQVLMP